MSKIKPTGAVETRTKYFKKYGVKPTGCLASNLGCDKTEHFHLDLKKKTVKCSFDRKDKKDPEKRICTSPFPKPEKSKKAKKVNKEKKVTEEPKEETKIEKKKRLNEESLAKVKKIQKKKKGKKIRAKQELFDVEQPKKKPKKEKVIKQKKKGPKGF